MKQGSGRETKRLLTIILVLLCLLVLCLLGARFLPGEEKTKQDAEASVSSSVTMAPSPSALSEEEPAATPTATPKAVDLSSLEGTEEMLDTIPEDTDTITAVGYQANASVLADLQKAVDTVEDNGYDAGFVLYDLQTGRSLSYNADEYFYSASSIKAFYIASTADTVEGALASDGASMEQAVRNSDNDAYQYLIDKYSFPPIREWVEQAGADPAIATKMYPYYGARQVAKLWAVNYFWFLNDPEGRSCASWYETPNASSLRQLVAEGTMTRTKAGWIYYVGDTAEDTFISTNEGGIVYEDHPFIIVAMTNAPADFTQLTTLFTPLLTAHDDMISDLN